MYVKYVCMYVCYAPPPPSPNKKIPRGYWNVCSFLPHWELYTKLSDMKKVSGKRNEKGWMELEPDSTVGVEF